MRRRGGSSLGWRLSFWPGVAGLAIVGLAAWFALVPLAVGLTLWAAMALSFWLSVDRRVTRRLARIEAQVAAVATPATPIAVDAGPDAIGSLTVQLNALLRRLHDRSGQLELRSFELGQSESRIASAHNIRNALSPISAILSQGLAQPPVAERALIERAVAELGQGDTPPERRARLVGYVMAAIDAAARARVQRLAELETGRTALANVLDILGDPASGDAPRVERCDVTDLIARNGAIARYGGGPSIAVTFPARPCWVCANRVILSQVIGNLFRNATEAISARGGDGGQITVTLSRGPSSVTVVIADDGEGFAPSLAPHLFQRGHSTRHAKSGGLGLHWCANAVAAMGGSLRLESDGTGLGANAILTLQIAS